MGGSLLAYERPTLQILINKIDQDRMHLGGTFERRRRVTQPSTGRGDFGIPQNGAAELKVSHLGTLLGRSGEPREDVGSWRQQKVRKGGQFVWRCPQAERTAIPRIEG